MIRLWKRWIKYTRDRAEVRVETDMYFYGTGYMIKKWWGYKHIPADTVVRKQVKA